MINPTGGGIRNDAEGQGHYGARRGHRLHMGVDYLCNVGQRVVAPINGRISRKIQVYPHDTLWQGVEIIGHRATVKLFYVAPTLSIIGLNVKAGDVIGTAQDISRKYTSTMQPHVHLEVTHVDPEIFVGV